MKLPPFLLDQWLGAYEFASPPIRFNLAASTGPAWTLGQLLALGGDSARDELAGIRLSYAPPEGSKSLRERIGGFYGVDPDWVVVTTGASEALSALLCMVADRDASIVLPFPAFPAMPVMSQAWGLGVQSYTLDRNKGFALAADAILAAVTRSTRLVLVNTPHNPTGSVMEEAELRRLAGSLDERGIPLLVDEVYHPLYFGAEIPSAAKVPNTIVISDFSKAFSLSGLRLGWIIDRDPKRREQLIDLRSYFTISSSPLTEAIGAHALAHAAEVLGRLKEVAQANFALLKQFMGRHRDTLGWIPPKGGTVAFPWLLDGRDSRPICQALAGEGVLVAPGDCFGLPEHFRLGVGAQATGFQDALDIASRVLSATAVPDANKKTAGQSPPFVRS
jgi:aspartate/methionine/tyrosine aminotransferase